MLRPVSYDVRFKGTLTYASAKAAKAAVAALAQAIDDEGCDSFVVPDELKVKGAAIAIDVDTSGPATMWEETLHFVEVLASSADSGAIKCWFDGELDDTIKPPKKKPAAAKPKAAPKPTPKRMKPNPAKLRMAAQLGEMATLEALLAGGTQPDDPDPLGEMGVTGLMMAAYHGRSEALARLIAVGATIDQRDRGGDTALRYAVLNKGKRGRRACIELLVAAGADPDAKDGDGESIRAYAKRRGYPGVVDLEEVLAARGRSS